MGVDGAGQNLRFYIAAKADIIFRALGMGNTGCILLDNRALIKISRLSVMPVKEDEFNMILKMLNHF